MNINMYLPWLFVPGMTEIIRKRYELVTVGWKNSAIFGWLEDQV